MHVYEFEDVVNKLKPFLSEYLQEKGIDTTGKFTCLFPDHEDSTPSCNIVGNEEPRFFCHGCLDEDELIWTKKGLIPIKDIKFGTQVLTHLGRYQTVLEKVNKQGRLLELNTEIFRNDPLLLTPDHTCIILRQEDAVDKLPYLNNEPKRGIRFYNFRKKALWRSKRYRRQLIWSECSADQVKSGDYIGYPVLQLTKEQKSIEGFIDYSLENRECLKEYTKGPQVRRIVKLPSWGAYLYGLYLAEGSTGPRHVSWSFHIDEADTLARRVKKILQKGFCLHSTIIKRPEKSICEVVCSKTDLARQLEYWFGKGAENKKIPQEIIDNWHITDIKKIIKGYIDGDGTKQKNRIVTISKKLAYTIFNLAVTLKMRPSLYKTDAYSDKTGIYHKTSWSIRFLKRESQRSFYETIDNIEYYLSKITNIELGEEDKKVVDIYVDGDNSFLTKLGAVHNCGRSGDIFDAVQLLEKKPKLGIDWVEGTLKYLANKYGIEIKTKDLTEEQAYELDTYRAYRAAAALINPIETPESIKRGWSLEILQEEGLGTVTSYDDFYNTLIQQGFSRKFLGEVDLSRKDLFNPDNLIFTWKDEKGRPIGFTARNMNYEQEKASAEKKGEKYKGKKYNNQRTTGLKCNIFQKGKRFYGIDRAIQATPPLYIFEGQADVITARAHGLPNCVAIAGSILHEDHIHLLKRLGIYDVVLCLDGDKTGRQKLAEALETKFAGNRDMKVRVTIMPDEEDPDSFFRKEGLEGFKALACWTAFEWRLNQYTEDADETEICHQMIPFIVNEPSPVSRDKLCKTLARRTGISLKIITEELHILLDARAHQRSRERRELLDKTMFELRNDPANAEVILQETQNRLLDLVRSHNSDQLSNEDFVRALDEQKTAEEKAVIGDVGFKLGKDLQELEEVFRGEWSEGTFICIGGKPNVGKCLTEDTRVLLANGTYKKIKDVVKDKDEDIITMNKNHQLVQGKVSSWIDSGILECHELTVSDNISIEVSKTHPFYTIEGWKKVTDLKVGDYIAVPNNYSCLNESNISEAKAEILAGFIAEGSLTSGAGFSGTEDELVDFFKSRVEIVFPNMSYRKDNNVWYLSDPTQNSNRVLDYLKNIGLQGKNSYHKFIPDDIFKSGKKTIARFLGMLWACDGWIAESKTGKLEVGISFCNRNLTEQVRSLLLRFGIRTRICESLSICQSSSDKRFPRYSISITNTEHIRLFYNNIHIPLTRKQEVLYNFLRNQNNYREQYKDNFPVELWGYIEDRLVESGLTLSKLSQLVDAPHRILTYDSEKNRFKAIGNYQLRKNRPIPRRILNSIGYILQNNFLISLAEGDISFVRIEKLVSIGRKQCYDLEIPHDHNFIANDFVVHNTAFLSKLAYSIAQNNPDVVVIYHTIDDTAEQLVPRFITIGEGSKKLSINMVKHPNYWTKTVGLEDVAPRREEGYKSLRQLAQQGKLVVKDLNHGGSFPFIENLICYYQDKYPDRRIIYILDNFHKLRDFDSKDERVRFKQMSESMKGISIRRRCCIISTVEYTKLAPGIKPTNHNIAECLTDDTLIYDAEFGSYIQLKNIQVGQLVTTINDQWKIEPKKVITKIDKGFQEVYKVTMKDGHFIKTTINHPFLSPLGWKKLSELSIGSSIAVPRKLNRSHQEESIDTDLARLLGYLAGDGSYNTTPSFTNKDEDYLSDVKDIVNNHFNLRIKDSLHNGSHHLRFVVQKNGQNPLTIYLKQLNIWGQTGKEKRIPQEIFFGNDEIRANYIAGLIATDGSVQFLKGKRRISFSNISLHLIYGLQSLLLGFGILSNVTGPDSQGVYRVVVRQSSYNKFADCIPVKGGKGNALRLGKLLHQELQATNTGLYFPPEFTEIIKKTLDNNQLPSRLKSGYWIQKKKINEANGQQIKEELGCFNSEINKFVSSDIIWTEIKSIELLGQLHTWDLEIEDTHNFVANDIFCHNTGQIEYDASAVIHLYSDVTDNPESFTVCHQDEDWQGQKHYLPRVEFIVGKNKITEQKKSFFLDFWPSSSDYRSVSQKTVLEDAKAMKQGRKEGLIEGEKEQDDEMGGLF